MDLQSLPWYGQFLVFLLIGAIAIGAFYMFYYKENQGRIDRYIEDIDKIELQIKTAEQKETKLPQLQEEKERKETALERLKEILPEKRELSEIIKNIESYLLNANLLVQQYAPPTQRKMQFINQHEYGIILEGTYHDLGIFLDKLSKIKKIFTVDKLRISPINRKSSNFTISASFTASTYTYSEKKGSKDKKKKGGRNK
jgi:type IV pilus assembly protein PilO